MSEYGDEFSAFFRGVWGADPFDWQVRLVEQVLRDEKWPDVLDLPTGSGKTAALDIAVYTLSVRPDLFARRIAFVVDRRLIVDQTALRAAALAAALQAPTTGAVRRVADRLTALSTTGVPLDVGRLRGGLPSAGAQQSDWLRWPDQPAVVVSTVDQFGSRLLFRGYGVSKGMRPVHAGLTGNDCLVLLDEVHLSTAVAETLQDVAQMGTVKGLPRRGQLVQMSATPVGRFDATFSLTEADLSPGSELAARVKAVKRARVVRVGALRAPLEKVLADCAPGLLAELGVEDGVLGVVVNRVASAREVGAKLRVALPESEVIVLTGRMRGLERTRAAAAAVRAADAEAADRTGSVVVVATQCIEVGADLSFDGLVTEVASLASLRQRFGRLDRRGRASREGRPAHAVIVGVESALSAPEDAVYGGALRATWDALYQRFGSEPFDVGPLSADLNGLPATCDVAPRVPRVLMPAHLELLSFTNPEPVRSPEVAGFLHGDIDPDSDVSVLWRADLDSSEASDVRRILELMPPAASELIAVPIGAARRWLAGLSPGVAADVDVADRDEAIESEAAMGVWRWRDGAAVQAQPGDLRPGDLLVAACQLGGLVDGVWAPESIAPVADVLEPAAASEGRLLHRANLDVDGSDDERQEIIAAHLESADLDVVSLGALRATRPIEYRPGRWLWVAKLPLNGDSLDGTDRRNSFVGLPVPLHSHLAGVGEIASEMAQRCGMSSELVDDLRLAGELHDLGKVDPRFQTWLHGSEIKAAMADEPLAKGIAAMRPGWRGGYPEGARHEFLSVHLACSATELLERANDPDLVLHLVSSHHGHARALPVVADDPQNLTVHYMAHGCELFADTSIGGDALGAEALRRFTTLQARYGCHGLTWLESILRLADHRRSELEATS
ncbi:MAG: type I-U CRISPR-associated helicase/endonuclease Cas3 [Ilumatobacter sp.]|nr:type I-U CRISPR-associated helicase/endonuclease Cas3 [Ilumatobacter sp.]